ncbi:metallo-beta-lactamase superfamily protein [Metarhizium guizhouense ARSEF 977]|uniref:Metallo-beta-lactamase superfamily protein n=1 Tax=Metarhizium guizhouense (strain ARSEF 977) TaxID=1276136 RepID=A0A0B4G333_METGA|nr:metallo-beta-lactamase superfamily protein [Metarhizium guizhouense ARSEF 977]KID83753.1 metallo-beta-lactamase superfamily protein [Metarhizium guizhouense ARSEF 977]
MTEVAPNVFCISGTDVNVVVLREDSNLTLIDGGWPGDVAAVEDAIRSIGNRPEDVRAILLTHAHIDHLGAVQYFHERFNVPVYADPIEVHHAAREYLEQATEADVMKGPMPQTTDWWERVLKVGAATSIKITDVKPLSHGPLDVPGRPVAVATHGHTSGHCAFYVPAARVVVTGDALVTGHACSTIRGPQLLPWFFNHSVPETLSALEALKNVDADIIIPGHGPPLNMPIAEAVEIALKKADDGGLHKH